MRSANTDYFHNFRFHASVVGPGGIDYLESTEAGFNTCSLPEITTENSEYREGIWTYTRKEPGIATVSDVTLGRGVTPRRSRFYEWMIFNIEGGEYKGTLTIYMYHRVGKEPDESANRTDLGYARKYVCEEAHPIRMKPGGDLDAMSSDISIAEVDISIERYKIVEPDTAYAPGWSPSAYLSL